MPTYNYKGKTYDIPDGMVEDFERKRPDATIAYQRGETIYDIPLSRRDAFLKKYPDATLYGGEAKKEEDSLMKAQPMWGSASYDENIAKVGSREYYPSPLNEQGRADYRPITIEDRAKQEYDMLMRQLSEFNITNGEFMDKYEASEKAARKQVNDGGFAMDSEQRRFIDANNADYRVKKQERDDLNNRLKNNSYFNELRTVEAESARETAEGIGNMMTQIDAEDPELKRLSRARTMSATSPRGGLSGFTFSKRKEDVDAYADQMADLAAAKRAYEKTAEIYAAPISDGNDVLKRFFMGAGERADDLDFWTMGASAIADDVNARQAFQKIQDKFGSVKELQYMTDEEIDALLTPSEQILISAYMDNLNAMYTRMDNTSGAYKAGQGAADSAMFMAQFLLTGGIGEAATSGAQKKLVGWLGRKIGTMSDGLVKNITRGATKLTVGTGTSIGKALVMTPLMPHTYANISDKLMSFDDNGELMSVTDAIISGASDALIETWSESTGDFVNKVLGVPGNLAKGVAKRYIADVPFDAWGHAMNAPMMKLLRKGGFNGFLGEMGEEFIGNAVRSAVGRMAPGSGLDPNSLKEFADLENLLVTAGSFAPMTIIGLGTSTAQYGWQKRKLANAQKAFENVLRNASYTEDQIKFAVDELLGSTDAHLTSEKLIRNFSPMLRELMYNDKFSSNRTNAVGAAVDFIWEIARYRAYDGVYHRMEQEQITDMQREIQEGTGREFWTTKLSDKAGMDGTAYEADEVRAVEFADGRVAYVLSSDGAQNTVVYNDGQIGFLSNEQLDQGKVDGTIVSDATMALNDYLTQQVARVRMSEEEVRMFEERGSNLEQIRAQFPQGGTVQLGTTEAPVEGTILEHTPDGAIVQMDDKSVRVATWEELGHAIGIEANPKTDAQQDEETINNLEIADLQRRRERERRRSERRRSNEVAMAETQMVDEAVNEGIEHPIPMKSDGTVDQTAFWNESPARWAEWKTEQRKDGGAYAATYIENAMNILSGQIAENEAAFLAEADFDAKDALEQTIAQQKQRLAELADLYQRYAPAVATTAEGEGNQAEAEGATETKTPEVMAERQKFEFDAEYQRRLSLAKSLTERVMILQEYFDKISGGSVTTRVVTKQNYKQVMKEDGCSEADIDMVKNAIAEAEEEKEAVNGLHVHNAVYMIAEYNSSVENGRLAYVHERQHNITSKDRGLVERVLALNLGRDVLANIVKAISGSDFYSDKSEEVLADEILSFAMEYAYTYDNISLPLSMKGFPIELINLINEINDEQRKDYSLANARRSKAQYDASQDNSGQNDGNQEEISGGLLGEEGTRSEEDSTRGTGEGSRGNGNGTSLEEEAGEAEEEEVLAEVETEGKGSFRVTKPEDPNGVTHEQIDEINKAIGGELELNDNEDAPVRFSITAIGHGAGLEILKDDGEGNVAFVLPDGRKFNAHNLLKPEDIKSLPDSVLSYMMNDARALGNIDARKEWMLWQKYTLMLNAILIKGSAENGGFGELASQWQWVADSVYKTVATNSDTQYSYSLDITRVCKKNEAVINAIAEMQARLGYGITPGQIMDIYMSTIEEGYQVPCPVCYVFSRYIRNGKYATIMINGQRKYGSKLVDPRTLSEQEKQKLIKYWLTELDKIQKQNEANENAIKRANEDITTLLDEIDKLSKKITDPRSNLTEEEKAETLEKIHELDARYKAALNVVSQSSLDSWITQFAIYKKKEGGKEKWVLYEDSYMGFPEEMALDLRQTSTVMRLYPAIQRFRKSRGAAAGKEITFVSNNDLGDVALALGSKSATEDLATPRDMSEKEWEELQKRENGALMAGQKNLYQQAAEETDPKKKAELLKRARDRFASASEYARRQSLRGGQRMWSWSDNIERLAPDVFVNLFQMEMLGGALQSYSKQLEGIKLVAAMNGYVNGSLMGKGNGYAEVNEADVEEENGKYFLKGGDFVMTLNDGRKSTLRTPVYKHTDGKFYTLEFDDVVGIDAFGKDKDGKHYKGLFELNEEYDKAGNILVGMNDLHIRIAMADSRIFFIIPWHSSGANTHILAQMYDYLGVEYDVTLSQDYTDVQSEKRIKGAGEKDEDSKKKDKKGEEKKESVPVSEFLEAFWNDHYENAREYEGYGMVAGKDFPCGIEGGIASSDGKGNLSEGQMHYRELRDAIFMGVKVQTGTDKKGKPVYKSINVEEYSEEWFNEIMADEFLSQVFTKVREYMGENGRMASQDCKSIYPYEYWDESSTYEKSSINGARYLEYCRRLGYKPKFCGKLDGKPEKDYGNFTEDAGYWKTLIDRRMYGVDGKFQGLTPVTAENFTPDLVDPKKTKEEFVVTTVADEAGTQTIVDRAIEKEKSRPGGIATVNYDMSLDQALKAYTGAESVDLIEEAKKAVAKADAKKKSKKTKKSEVRMRITAEQDKAYMDAVNAGDMETAQRMVIEAARLAMPNTKIVDENGNPIVMYHGSPNKFTTFDIDRFGRSDLGSFGRGFYFTSIESRAKRYGENVVRVFLNVENPINAKENEVLSFVFGSKDKKDVLDRIFDPNDNAMSQEEKEIAATMANEDIVNESKNYDGVDATVRTAFDEVVVRDSSQIKSAEPVTYDDAGNVIPLSQRFNPENEDIRFSIRTDEQREKLFEDAKAHYGVTKNFNAAGYMLPDGSLLDFSEANDGGDPNSRSLDHRDIEGIIMDNGVEYDSRWMYIADFMNEGAIRLLPESAGINLIKAPTEEQRKKIFDFIYKYNGEVILEINDERLNSVVYMEYDRRTSPARIFRDIDGYFNEGIVPEQTSDLRFSIIGERGAMNDKTQEGLARLANLDVARQMESELNPDWKARYDENALKVKVATGWERGADGKWRYEVDDIVIRHEKEWMDSKKKLTLRDIVEPNPIFDMYPDLLDIKIVKDRSKYSLGASYNHKKNEMKLPFGALKDDADFARDYGFAPRENKSFLRTLEKMATNILHEVQHAIQDREGFAAGGNSNMLLPKDKEQYASLVREYNTLAEEYNAILNKEGYTQAAKEKGAQADKKSAEADQFLKTHRLGESGYKRLAGEVEASNVEKRSKLSDYERYNSLLASTEDVARKDQIFLMNSVRTTESSVRFSVSNADQAIFVSNAAKAVEGIKQEKATPEQWLKMIEKNGGLKAGEDKWMGLSDWLKASDKKTLTKQEVLGFINENMIQIEETHYKYFFQDDIDEASEANMRAKYGEEFMKKFFGDAFIVEDDMYRGWRLAIFNEETAVQLYNEANGTSMAEPGEYGLETEDYDIIVKWGTKIVRDAETINGVRRINDTRQTYQSNGLTNRHEIALTVPTIESWNEDDAVHFGEAGEGRAVAWIRFGETIAEVSTEAEKEAWKELDEFIKELYAKYGDSDAWTLEESKKYSDLLAKTKATKEQKKVLVIDEIQSKRHQDAREMGGYRVPNVDKWLADHGIEVKETGEFYEFYHSDGEMDRRYSKGLLHYNIEEAKKLYVSGYNRSSVPDAPFEKNWHELAMKRMLRYAAENGYDAVAWTKGDQQNKRYNLSKVVDHIQLGMDFTKQRESSFRMFLKNGKDHHVGVDRETGLVTFYNENKKAIGKPLSELLGKELAEKVLGGRDYQILTEVDFELSEGMKGFYDKILPAFMNKYGKQWGVKVSNMYLNRVEEGIAMHSIPVTEEMKASVMEGQVMFRTTEITPKVRAEMDVIAATAIVNGNYMKAPNGKDTNLTAEQWAMVRTKNFKEWFGEWINDPENASKVVDENGEPKVVYHGTPWNPLEEPAGTAVFKSGWFTGMKRRAEGFGEPVAVFLNIKNPAYSYDKNKENDSILPDGFDLNHTSTFGEYDGYISYVDYPEVPRVSEFAKRRIMMMNPENYEEVISQTLAEMPKGQQIFSAIPKDSNQIKSATDNIGAFSNEEEDIRFSIRTSPAPEKTGIGYKVFYLKGGKLYPPMVANQGGVDTPVGVWLDAEEGTRAGVSKTGRPKVKQGGKGTQGGSGTLAYRPGWHLGEIPYAIQFNRKDENGDRTLFPADFVWAEVEYANDVDYQDEAMSYGMNANGKFQHSLAGLPKLPTDGSYRYRTNPNPETDPWIITGAMKVNRILTPSEVDQMVIDAGREPQKRQEGAVTDEQIEALNKELGLVENKVNFRINENPTEAQKEAGNYKMGHLNLDGYRITIENPKGSVRRGTDSEGNAWENTLNNDYGYIRGTEGVDGDHIDVYLSDNPSEGNVFVIDQVNPKTMEFDEHKVMYGFNSAEEAREAYLANFSEGWNGLGTITEVSKDEFKKWIQSSHRKTKPFSEYKSVNAISSQSEGMEDEVMLRVTGTPTDEVVASGLDLSPAQTADLAGNIFAALPESARAEVTASLNGDILGLQDAIMQIPARLAMKENWDETDKELASVVREKVQDIVDSKGATSRPLTTKEALWMLYGALNKETDFVSEASRVLVRRNLGFDPQTQRVLDDAGNGVRFRTVGNASINATASLYNRGAANVWTRIKESFTDMNASVEELVKAIEKRSRKKAEGFENVLMALNQQSSKGLAAMESYTQKFLNPLFDEISKVMRKANKKYEDVVRYVILKHGLERNIKLAMRDARAYYQEIYDDIIAKINSMNDSQKRTYLTNAQLRHADAKAELARLQAIDQTTLTEDQLRELKSDLAKARKAVTETEIQLERAKKVRNMSEQEAKDELDKIFKNIEAGKDSKFKELRENDYSGISSMFYDLLGVDRTDWQTEEEYQAELMRAKQDRFNTLADVEAEAQKEVTDFEKSAETKDLWKAINKATKETLRQQYEANMISKEQYLNLRDMFEFYVPLRGFKDNTAEDMYTYYRKPNSTGYTKPILGAEGRKTEAESPFGWIAAMAGSAIASNVKNEAKLALFYFVSNRPENGVATISKTWYVHTPNDLDDDGKRIFKPTYPPFTEDLSTAEGKAKYEVWQANMKELQKQGLAYESGQRLNLGNAVVNIDSKNQPEHIVNVKVGGKDYTILINGNPRAAQAINGDLNIEATVGDYSMVFGPILRWMSSVNTSYNPEFWVTNMMRDMLFTAMAVSIKEDPAYRRKFAKNYAKALKVVKLNAKNEKGTLGNDYLDKMYKDFVKYGGVTGYTQIKDNETWEQEIEKYLKSNNPQDIKAGVALKKAKEFFHGMHRFGESLEQISRFAAFLTSREMGKSMTEAISDAKEITVNFNRKGSGKMISYEESKYLTDANGQPLNKFERWLVVGFTSIAPLGRRCIMFFNAAIQGLNATYQLWKKNKVRSTAWALGYATVGVMNAVLHALMDDDDDYLDIPEYERRNSLLIGWNGTYAKWALPQEARAFYALGDLAVETLLGRNKHEEFLGMHGSVPAFLSGMTSIFGEVLPINPTEGWKAFMPSVLIPGIEILLNEDYKGAPIYNDLKWLSEEERARTERWAKAYRGTGKMYIDISKFLNNMTDDSDLDEVGFINLPPEALEHIVQSVFGGTIRTVDKFINTVTAAIDPETDVTVRQFPFLNRLVTINDERYKNVHVNDVYDYYAAEAEYVIDLQNEYFKTKDHEALERLKMRDEYKWADIYKKYIGAIKRKQDEIKSANGNAERARLMKEQDEIKRQMIEEISNL